MDINVSKLITKVFDTFTHEAYKTIDEHPDVFTDELKKKIKIRVTKLNGATIFCDDLLYTKHEKDATFTKDEIRDEYKKFRNDWAAVPYRAETPFAITDGKIEALSLIIVINMDVVRNEIIFNLNMLDDFFELTKMDARHEVGHLIHFIMYTEGIDKETYIKDEIEYQEQLKEYREKRDKFMDSVDYETSQEEFDRISREIDTLYYNIPYEHSADVCGGVDREKYLDLKYKDRSDKIRINVINENTEAKV